VSRKLSDIPGIDVQVSLWIMTESMVAGHMSATEWIKHLRRDGGTCRRSDLCRLSVVAKPVRQKERRA
jgi:hypothetical protein